MKSFFIDELQTMKNESLKSANIRNTSTNIVHGTVNSLQTKIKLLKKENKLLKDDIKNKQKLIDSFKNSTSFEKGLSDQHHLIYSMLKKTFHKEEPKP